jgi:hypothetical protein
MAARAEEMSCAPIAARNENARGFEADVDKDAITRLKASAVLDREMIKRRQR